MTRKSLSLLLLLALVPLSSLMNGCATPSCGDYANALNSCTNKLIIKYGRNSGQICDPAKPSACKAGSFCLRPAGSATATCFYTESVNKAYQEVLYVAERKCDEVFAKRQQKYMNCAMTAASTCDIDKLQACVKSSIIKPPPRLASTKEESNIGSFLLAFLPFLLAMLVFEGLFIFIGLKVADRSNPKNTIVRAMTLGALMAVITYPIVYSVPLPGILLSSSVFFGLIIVFYQQEVFFSMLYTSVHIVWVWLFFTLAAAGSFINGDAWVFQSHTFRRELTSTTKTLHKSVLEFREDRKKEAAAKKRAEELKKEAEERQKAEAAAKKAKEKKK